MAYFIEGTGAVLLPKGNTADREAEFGVNSGNAVHGMARFNSDLGDNDEGRLELFLGDVTVGDAGWFSVALEDPDFDGRIRPSWEGVLVADGTTVLAIDINVDLNDDNHDRVVKLAIECYGIEDPTHVYGAEMLIATDGTASNPEYTLFSEINNRGTVSPFTFEAVSNSGVLEIRCTSGFVSTNSYNVVVHGIIHKENDPSGNMPVANTEYPILAVNTTNRILKFTAAFHDVSVSVTTDETIVYDVLLVHDGGVNTTFNIDRNIAVPVGNDLAVTFDATITSNRITVTASCNRPEMQYISSQII